MRFCSRSLAFGQVALEPLDSHRAAQADLDRSQDLAHTTRADHALDAVTGSEIDNLFEDWRLGISLEWTRFIFHR